MKAPIIRVKSLNKTVKTSERQLTILDDISFNVEQGTSVAITGSSGAGKSTLLGLLAGLDAPTSGEIYLGDNNITQMDEEGRAQVRADMVGFVFQTFQLLNSLTALENVALPMELAGTKVASKNDAIDKARNYLDRVGLLKRASHYPLQLSGGEQQRVAIARAFACQPEILFADEPTGNLDQDTGHKVSDLLFDLNKQEGTTLVLVTHEQRLANRCEHHIEIDKGKINPS